jgi:hypothetical protein
MTPQEEALQRDRENRQAAQYLELRGEEVHFQEQAMLDRRRFYDAQMDDLRDTEQHRFRQYEWHRRWQRIVLFLGIWALLLAGSGILAAVWIAVNT